MAGRGTPGSCGCCVWEGDFCFRAFSAIECNREWTPITRMGRDRLKPGLQTRKRAADRLSALLSGFATSVMLANSASSASAEAAMVDSIHRFGSASCATDLSDSVCRDGMQGFLTKKAVAHCESFVDSERNFLPRIARMCADHYRPD